LKAGRPALVASAVLASLAANGRQDLRPAGERRWVAFETTAQSGLPIVMVRLNGSDAYRLLLDPSIKEVLLDNTLVVGAGLKLAGRGEEVAIDYYGFEEKVPVVYLQQLELGPVAVGGVRALLIEGDDATAREGIPSYGRVGSDFLEPFRLTLHYPRKLMLLEASPANEEPPGGARFDLSGRFLTVPVRVNETLEASFILDPGASESLLDRRWARARKLARTESVLRLGSLTLGSFQTTSLPVTIVDMSDLPYLKGSKWGRGERPVGVLGASLLRNLALTYDFPRRLIWLRVVKASGGER
jgi:hypothetical protein